MVPPGMPKRYSTPSASNALRTAIAPLIFSFAMCSSLTSCSGCLSSLAADRRTADRPRRAPGGARRRRGPLLYLRLELRDGLLLREEEAELVDAVHEAVAGEALDLEGRLRAVGERDGLLAEVDRHLLARRGEQLRHRRGLEHDREEAVLEGVVPEDVGDARRDHGLEAVVDERPRRVLAGGAAAEVVARHEHRAALGRLRVEDEVRPRLPGGVVAPVGEEPLPEPLLVGHLQEAAGDDLVGVDVLARDDDRAALDFADRFHG